MRPLHLWDKYSREEVHDIFAPDTAFTPQAGSWGLWGIVRVPNRPGSFVFFVTFGQSQGAHDFDESITANGVLTWQSQPRQTLTDSMIQEFINHDDRTDAIHLFLRTKANVPYSYLGTLGYLAHDAQRERPVHFQWQLMDWPPPQPVLADLGVTPAPATAPMPPLAPGRLQQVAPPQSRPGSRGTGEFGSDRQPLHPDQGARNAALGLAGEKLVVKMEQERLTASGRSDLAAQVVHVALVEGDSAGYDVRSYDDGGQVRYIEVKTTSGAASAAFFISPNEIDFSARHLSSYVLIRIFAYDTGSNSGRYYEVPGAVTAAFSLTATEYRARLM